MSYSLTNREYSRLKSRLTRAINSGDPEKIITEVEYAEGVFNDKGWPDGWARWEIAKSDAESKLARVF